MQSNPNDTLKTTLPDLASTDAAVPNLWDSRFQVLLNNDSVLDRRVKGFENGTTPARSLQQLADYSALRAFVGAGPAEIAYLPGQGLYHYYTYDTSAERLPYVVKPDNNVGRWRLDFVPLSVVGVAGGVASLDGNGFLAQSLLPGSVTADKLAGNAVTLDKLASLTPDDTAALAAGTLTATLLQIINMLARQVRQATGKGSWLTSPAVNLEILNSYGARIDRTQSWTQAQSMTSLTVSGDLIIPVR